MRRLLTVLVVIALAGCKKTPMDRVESIRSELEGDAPKLDAFPKCADRAACAKDVAAAIGGTYDDKKPPVDSPDHSACVQRVLSRKDGPGAAYGQGLFRGAAGALASWKETLAALHDGSSQMAGRTKEVLDKRLSAIDAATAKIALEKVDAPAGNQWNQMQEEHASKLGGDAGAPK